MTNRYKVIKGNCDAEYVNAADVKSEGGQFIFIDEMGKEIARFPSTNTGYKIVDEDDEPVPMFMG